VTVTLHKWLSHNSLLNLLQPPLVFVWLQSSDKGYFSRYDGSSTALSDRRLKTVSYQSQSYFTAGGLHPISSSWRQPLETHDQRFFQLNPCDNSPYVISSLTRRWFCVLRICLTFRQVYISHIKHVIEKFFLLHYTPVLCQYRLCRADHAYLTYLMLQRQLSHLNGQSQSYFTTGCLPPISSFWRQAP
jgi:hypothetical protein